MQPDHPRLVAGVVMKDVKFFSPALGREMVYRVLLPEKTDAGAKFPVVYLLHGNGGGFRDWSNQSDAAKYAAEGLILVMPEGDSSYFLNAANDAKDRYEDYLIHDVITDVETRFRAKSGRENRAVIGVSMGGFAAIELALSHPDLFILAGAMSPPVDVPQRGFSWRRIGQWYEFRRIFGPLGSEARRARDPFVLVQSAKSSDTPYIYLTAGEQEPLLEPDRRFAERLRGFGFRSEFHTQPGGHDWREWNEQIPGCFARLLQVSGDATGS